MVTDKDKNQPNIVCPICNSFSCESVIEYRGFPVMQNYIEKSFIEAKNCEQVNIGLSLCENCGFVFNSNYNEEKLRYLEGYDNNRDYSNKYIEYLNEVKAFIGNSIDLTNKKVLEIGCGNGSFLFNLCSEYGSIGYGYDPSYVEDKKVIYKDVYFFNQYYDQVCENEEEKYDLIILRHLIEHLQNPKQLLIKARNSVKEGGLIYIETPSFNWILNNFIVFDIFYEHCSYYTDEALENILRIIGIEPVKIDHKFNDQYVCVIGKYSKESKDWLVKKTGNNIKTQVINFEKNKNLVINKVTKYLNKLKENGNISLWGAAAKGSTFCCMFDKEKTLIECVVDINANKQGKYLPISGHKVIRPEELTLFGIKYIIITNSVYFEEIKEIAKSIDDSIVLIKLESIMRRLNKGEEI